MKKKYIKNLHGTERRARLKSNKISVKNVWLKERNMVEKWNK